MKNLLLFFLVVIFSLQAAFAAAGYRVAATSKVAQACVQVADSADPAVSDTDQLKASSALEELSDYLPPDLAMPRNGSSAIAHHAPQERPLSVVLLPRTPPPRT